MHAVTRPIADFAAALRYDSLPPEVPRRARQLLLDQVGIALRARNEAALSGPASAALTRLGLATGGCTVIGDAADYAPPAAAFFNGNLGHSLDFDDTHARGSLHPSAPIVPAALAAAELGGADGRTLLTAIVAGYEVQIRLAIAIDPSAHYARGFHPTATCGVFGAAVAAARVLGLDTDHIVSALGLAGSQAAGSLQFLADGAWNKPFHVGLAAMNGLIAAIFAADGYQGTREPIEGRAGFLRAYAPDADPSAATAGLGERWETLAIALKPYPSCRYSHAPLDALIAVKAANDIDYREVESVEIRLPETGWHLIGEPEESKHRPRSYVDCQFSMPFLAAIALREGTVAWDHYRRHLEDPDTRALCRRVRALADAQAEAEFPAYMSGGARIRTARGSFEQFVRVPKGEPANFLSDAEIRAKFDTLAGPYVAAERRDTIAAAVLGVADCADIGELLRLTRPGAGRAASSAV